MDNITHSLTGALAAKIIETNNRANHHNEQQDQKSVHRTVFWLMVIAANLPDVDALFNWTGDPFFFIKNHRGLTHSLLFAPVLSFLPAIIAYLITLVKNLKLLWMTALIGVYLHIFFDLITSFGTQLFAPVSVERYSLDWMFIIDPIFTGIILLLLTLGRRRKPHAQAFALAGGVFIVSYLLMEMISHSVAYNRVVSTAREHGIVVERVSTLAQPLNVFRWMGLVQAQDGVYQTFFTIFDNSESPEFTKFLHADDPFVELALKTEEAGWFMAFARHPLVESTQQGDQHLVVMRDMQFSVDPGIVQTIGDALGVPETERRGMPFVLQLEYSHDGKLLTTKINR